MITSKNCLQKCNDFIAAIQNGSGFPLLAMAGAWHTVYDWCSENIGEDFHKGYSGIEAVIRVLEQLKQKADAAQQQDKNQ